MSRSRTGCLLATSATLLVAGLGQTASAGSPDGPTDGANRQLAPTDSLLAPLLDRGITRVHGTVRPFFNVLGRGAGAVSDLSVEHYFWRPVKLGLELAPLALAIEPRATGAIAHIRAHAAWAGDYLELGAGLGAMLQHYGPSGLSLASNLRLGSLDGLHLGLEIGYSMVANYYTGRTDVTLADLLAELDVPLTRRLMIEGSFGLGYSYSWAYFTLGLKDYLRGRGGPGSIVLTGAFGVTWVMDRLGCQFVDPASVTPCSNATSSFGPTIGVGVDRRF